MGEDKVVVVEEVCGYPLRRTSSPCGRDAFVGAAPPSAVGWVRARQQLRPRRKNRQLGTEQQAERMFPGQGKERSLSYRRMGRGECANAGVRILLNRAVAGTIKSTFRVWAQLPEQPAHIVGNWSAPRIRTFGSRIRATFILAMSQSTAITTFLRIRPAGGSAGSS